MSRSETQQEVSASLQSVPGGGSIEAVVSMLEAKSVALVGASERSGSFGERMVLEAQRSVARPEIHLVNPRYESIRGHRCLRSLDEIDHPVDLVLFGVPDSALEKEMQRAARRGDRSAVVFGNAYEEPVAGRPSLRERVRVVASEAGMALCGGGCMGFVNVSYGLRAVGYIEPAEIPLGPVALVTHSGSIFSAMLRTRRHLGFTLAVSSGQELVTSTASYLEYALGLEKTRVVALVLETMRDPDGLRRALERAANRDVRVVALTVGASTAGRSMVEAHTGALAGAGAAWEALFDAYDVAWVKDLEEFADTVELFSAGTRSPVNKRGGLATVHDSGAERALVADWADEIGVRFAEISPTTRQRLGAVLEPGLEPANPLDVWGTGAETARVFGECLSILSDDPDVAVVALAVDLVHEEDFDDSYPRAAIAVRRSTTTPLCVLANMASALDADVAA
ncbi:MAG TPA: CoA-binding protein, partial [Acidimicrobiales bacterium]|nr:CoA-binding protein [Acidimicrobiales bacterium]